MIHIDISVDSPSPGHMIYYWTLNRVIDDIKHKTCLGLPESKKQQYLQEMKVEAPISGILRSINEEVRENYDEYKENPVVHQLTSYDNLYYLKNSNIKDNIRKDKKDYKSVKKWIEENKNDFIYHNLKGDRDSEYPVSKT